MPNAVYMVGGPMLLDGSIQVYPVVYEDHGPDGILTVSC